MATTQLTLHADPLYDFVDLGTLGGAMSQAYGVNDYGQIVGVSTLADGTQRAFSYTLGSGMIDLGTLGGASSIAYDINNLGQITGAADTSYTSSDPSISPRYSEAFLYSNGVMTGLGGLQFTNSGNTSTYLYSSIGRAINNLGQVTGQSYFDDRSAIPGHSGFQAVLWQNGSIQTLPLPTTSFQPSASGLDINDSGVVLALSDSKPFIYDGSILTALSGILGSSSIQTSITGINESGMVVGNTVVGVLQPTAFVYSNGQVQLLNPPAPQALTSGYSLNDAGVVVGDDLLWEQGQVFRLDDVTQGLNGFNIVHAGKINNLGEIVGWGTTSDGSTHAFMLSPVVVPEPSSLLLLAAAGCLLVAGRRRNIPLG